MGWWKRRAFFSVALSVAGLIAGTVPYARAEGPYLTLTETVPDDPKYFAGQWTIDDGRLLLDLNGGIYKNQFSWSKPPQQIDVAGFDLTVSIAGQVASNCQPMYAGIGVSGGAFRLEPNPLQAEINLVPPAPCDNNVGRSDEKSATGHVAPVSGLVDGDIYELRIGAAYGPGVAYRYRVSLAAPPPGGDEGGGGGGGNGGGGGSGNGGADGSLACGFSLGSGILDKWQQTGGEAGFLGCATSNEAEAGQSPMGTAGRYALFQHGVIVWHGTGQHAGASFEVHGCIASLYQGMSGTNSFLGFPVSDEYDTGGGRRSDFEGGYIVWNAATGVCNAHRNGNVTFTYERDTNRPGFDYRHFDLAQDNAALCRDACAAEDQCVAYTFLRAGLDGSNPARCWLKSAIPNEQPDACCVSGKRR